MSGKKNDPRAVALVAAVIVLIAAAVGLRLWANQERLQVPTFGAMSATPDGQVLIVLGNELFVETAGEESPQVLDLSELGVETFYGSVQMLSDGSVVLGRGRLGEAGLLEGTRMFLRERPAPDDPIEVLQRCNLVTRDCTVLAGIGNALRLRRGFSIDVDESAGFIYATDPANHRVVQASLDGEQLDVSEAGWRFPNGVRVLDVNRVAFADTNHHRYVELAVGPDGFGEVVEEQSILGWPGVTEFQRFPFEIHVDGEGQLWMLVAGPGMDDAVLILRAPEGSARLLELPERADPIALAEVDGKMLAADARHYRIHAFDMDGRSIGDFGSQPLRERLDDYRKRYTGFELIFDYSLLAVFVFALPALVAGMYLQYRTQTARVTGPLDSPVSESGPSLETVVSTQEGQLAKLRGEYVFWRKFTPLGTQEGRRFLFLFAILLLAMIGMIAQFAWWNAEQEGTSFAKEFDDLRFYFIFIVTMGLAAFYWLSGMYERVIVNRDGIRYVSFLSGPLGFLNVLHPDWFVPWNADSEQVIQLTQRGPGKRPQDWYYQITAPGERPRKLNPFAWRLAGDHEVGIPLKSVTRLNAETLRQTIHKTLLYRLLYAQATSVGPR